VQAIEVTDGDDTILMFWLAVVKAADDLHVLLNVINTKREHILPDMEG